MPVIHDKFWKLPPIKERKHGRSAYVRGCRCSVCRDANSKYQTSHQKQHAKNGLCSKCSEPSVAYGCCLKHAVKLWLKQRMDFRAENQYSTKITRILDEAGRLWRKENP